MTGKKNSPAPNRPSWWIEEPEDISREEAYEDLEFLIWTLKYGYAGYELYGGDERFDQAKAEVEAELAEFADSDRIDIEEFLNMLYKALRFIEDTHFSLGSRQMGTSHTLFVSNQYMFREVDDSPGTFKLMHNEDIELLELDGRSPEEALHPVLGR
ncbi:MAG: hypothetical protein ACQEQG_10675, partial [Bacillota bacterium]